MSDRDLYLTILNDRMSGDSKKTWKEGKIKQSIYCPGFSAIARKVLGDNEDSITGVPVEIRT
jgi:hypothetical protein